MAPSSRRVLAGFAAAAATAVILALTLQPASAAVDTREVLTTTCIICGSRGTADAILNVFLFAPFGAALVLAGWRVGWVVLTAALLSTGIEATQLGLVGRYASVGDVIWNTTGAALAALLAARAGSIRAWVVTHRRAAGAALVALPVVVVGATAWLLLPAPQEGTYYGQWTADLGPSLGVYRGRIFQATIGDQPAPSRRLRDSAASRRAILAGEPIRLRFVAGAPPARLAPIFSIYDGRHHEVLLLGAEGDDMVLRIRRKAEALRLDEPTLRWRGALAGIAPGDTITAALRRSGPWGFCLKVTRPGPSADGCAEVGAWRGWALLADPSDAPPWMRSAADVVWVLAGVAVAALGLWILRRPPALSQRPPGDA